jgi:hypothetical protein
VVIVSTVYGAVSAAICVMVSVVASAAVPLPVAVSFAVTVSALRGGVRRRRPSTVVVDGGAHIGRAAGAWAVAAGGIATVAFTVAVPVATVVIMSLFGRVTSCRRW